MAAVRAHVSHIRFHNLSWCVELICIQALLEDGMAIATEAPCIPSFVAIHVRHIVLRAL